jgi:hypothetical protein
VFRSSEVKTKDEDERLNVPQGRGTWEVAVDGSFRQVGQTHSNLNIRLSESNYPRVMMLVESSDIRLLCFHEKRVSSHRDSSAIHYADDPRGL